MPWPLKRSAYRPITRVAPMWRTRCVNPMSIDPSITSPLATALRAELAAVLDAVPASRRVLQHLAVVEHQLKTQGLRGLRSLPEPVLAKAHTQLASLPLGAGGSSLHQLLDLLALAVDPPVDATTDSQPSDQFLSSFLTEDKLEVSDATHSDFQRVVDESASRNG
jgi:hypothetical protein